MSLLSAIAKSIEISDYEVGASRAEQLRSEMREISVDALESRILEIERPGEIPDYEAAVARVGRLRSELRDVTASTRLVLQFNALPMTLDTREYRNARSGSNPEGDLKALFKFRELVDPVPSFTHYYGPSGISTEKIYGQIVNGASVSSDSPFTAGVIADVQKQFAENHFPDMDGTPGTWRPVYADPEDWCDALRDDRFKQIAVDLDDLAGEEGTYAIIGEPTPLKLSVGMDSHLSWDIDPETKVRSGRMKYLEVKFNRPWLDLLLFKTRGWHLSGQNEGFCSSGSMDENCGIIPLVPVGLLLAKDTSVDVEWSKKDQVMIDSAKSSKNPVFLGPITLEPQGLSSTLQVICWINALVPHSPQK